MEHIDELAGQNFSRLKNVEWTERLGELVVPTFREMASNWPDGTIAFEHDSTSIHDPEREIDTGLFRRHGKEQTPHGGYHDNKVLFHYRRGLIDRLKHENPAFYRRYVEWLNCLSHIHELGLAATFSTLVEFAKRGLLDPAYLEYCDPTKPGPGAYSITRVIGYLDPRVGDEGILARAHYDKSCISLALYEDAPGLEFEAADGTYIPMHSLPRQPVVFTGLKLQEATSGRFSAVHHRVRAVDGWKEKQQQDGLSRISIVFFLHPDNRVVLRTRGHR